MLELMAREPFNVKRPRLASEVMREALKGALEADSRLVVPWVDTPEPSRNFTMMRWADSCASAFGRVRAGFFSAAVALVAHNEPRTRAAIERLVRVAAIGRMEQFLCRSDPGRQRFLYEESALSGFIHYVGIR
jgi:hypothetical protein